MTAKTKDKPLDLDDISPTKACDKGYELELRHPATKKPLGVFITVLGKESSAYRQHIRDIENEAIRKRFERSQKGGEPDLPTAEKREKGEIALVAAVTTGWRNVVLGGEELPFSEANARKLYAEPWIRAQVDAAVHDLGNFFAD